jgi:putative ATPase
MRPETIADFIGQSHLTGPGKPFREAIEHKVLHSMILWGPSGSGKTTLAKLLARSVPARVETFIGYFC